MGEGNLEKDCCWCDSSLRSGENLRAKRAKLLPRAGTKTPSSSFPPQAAIRLASLADFL